MRVISDSNIIIENQTFTSSIGAYMEHPDGRPYHTFRTATLLVDGSDVLIRNCVIENTAGPSQGQSIALYLDGDNITVEDCTIRSFQDTLFLAPLPETAFEKDGFLGPKEFEPRTPRTYAFRRCLIEGTIDFIFGGATAFFEDCEFRSIAPGYVFAPCTPAEVSTGFVAKNCVFSCSDDVPDHSCYIGRPWREYGAVKIVDCKLDRHIHPDGWQDWGKEHSRIRFEGYPLPW